MSRRNAGYSLIEMVIASALLALLVGVVYSLMNGASNAYVRDSARQTLQDNARRVLDELTAELRDSTATYCLVSGTLGSNTITFRKAKGFNTSSGAPVWTSNIVYRYEISNSVDANNDNVANEGRIVREGPNAAGAASKAVLCDFVQPGGFKAVQTGNRIDLSISLYSYAEGKRKVDVTMTSSVALRNQP